MGFLDKAKAAAVEATAKAKEGVEDVQLKRELSQAYNELGKVAFELVESNEINHPRLETVAEKIRALNERDKGDGTLVGATAGGTSEPHDPSQPPAMPT
jgi:cob(I)alamin adenosyltransferase